MGGVFVGTVGPKDYPDAISAGFFDRKWKRDRHFTERQDIPEQIIAGLGSRSEAAFEAVAPESTHGGSPQPLARVRPRHGRLGTGQLHEFVFHSIGISNALFPQEARYSWAREPSSIPLLGLEPGA